MIEKTWDFFGAVFAYIRLLAEGAADLPVGTAALLVLAVTASLAGVFFVLHDKPFDVHPLIAYALLAASIPLSLAALGWPAFTLDNVPKFIWPAVAAALLLLFVVTSLTQGLRKPDELDAAADEVAAKLHRLRTEPFQPARFSFPSIATDREPIRIEYRQSYRGLAPHTT